MNIINIQQIKKYHAANLILDGVTLQLQEGEKTALIGRNGSGKSSLLRIISGYDHADEGTVSIKKDLRIGYLPQIPAEFEELTVYEVLAYGFRGLAGIKREMRVLEQQMAGAEAAASPDKMEALLHKYAEAQNRFEQGSGYGMDTAIDQAASGLQISRSLDGRRFGSLSGGEKTRVVLASQLVTRPDLLLLDEPTNHLDLKGVEWLEQFLRRYEGACVIVSHDRYFLDAVTTRTIELEDGEASLYLSSYSGYVKEKETRLLQQYALYEEQQKTVKKMNETIRQLEEWGRIGGNEKFFKRAASIRKALERMDKLKRPVLERRTADFELVPHDRSGHKVIEFEGVSLRLGERDLFKDAEGNLAYGEKVVLLGDNGSGKSTFFRLLLGEASPDAGGIKLGSRVDIGYLAQQEPADGNETTVLDYFRTGGGLEEGEARHMLARYLFYGAEVFKPIQALSGGEWSRLRLALLVRRKPNLLLLDEPTNHLDIASREALEEALEEFPGTVLAISHDRYFINRLAGRVWELKDGRITSHTGNYEDYKEKRERRLWREGMPLTASTKAAKPPAAREQRMPAAGGSGRENKRNAGQLELEIAALEAELRQADEECTRMSEAGDTVKLEASWRKREETEAKLNALLELWLELGE